MTTNWLATFVDKKPWKIIFTNQLSTSGCGCGWCTRSGLPRTGHSRPILSIYFFIILTVPAWSYLEEFSSFVRYRLDAGKKQSLVKCKV